MTEKKEDYDLDVDNYSENELIALIKYKGDITSARPVDISSHINNMIVSSVMNKDGDVLVKFLKSANSKLLNYIERRESVQLAPTNYEVIQSMNEIQEDVHQTVSEKVPRVSNTYDYKFPMGVINPIERRIVTKLISIDSVFRQEYNTSSPSDFTWVMPHTQQKVVSLKLVSLELPVMWYPISKKNNSNKFIIRTYNVCKVDDAGIKVIEDDEHLIEIPSGNYTAGEFSLSLSNYFLNRGNGLEYLICEVNSVTMKTVFRARDDGNIYDVNSELYSPDFYFEIDFGYNILNNCDNSFNSSVSSNVVRDDNYNMSIFLGFNKRYYKVDETNTYDDYTSSSILNYKYYLESDSCYGNGRLNYIYVSVDDFNKNYITDSVIASTKSHSLGDSIMGRVSINETFSSVVLNTAGDKIFKQRDYMGPVNISKFRIRLLDKFGRVLDVNNNDFSLALEATLLYG